MRILVVEDEKYLNRVITELMEDEGYSVDSCFNGLEALDYLACAKYDVIILDIMMPKLDGMELLQLLRQRRDMTPVVFLTSRDTVTDKVKGLEGGGDYYLVKPFESRELLAVIHVMARKHTPSASNIYTLADLTVDTSRRRVSRAGREIELTGKEYALLEYMIRNQGVTLSREQIENNIWNYEYEGGTNVVNVYIGYLRKKIDAGFDKKLIHNVWGRGGVLKEE